MSDAVSSPLDPIGAAPLSAGAVHASAAEQASHRRAMPIDRLVAGGMRIDDARGLHRLSEEGVAWQAAAEWLAERNLRVAEAARTTATARAFLYFASAALRFGQGALDDADAEKHTMHARMVATFARASAMDEPPAERIDVAWRGGAIGGWLVRPPGVADAPVVIAFGGFDGWREEYHAGALALAARGVATLLTEVPGQGEARLRHGLFLRPDFPDALSAIADRLSAVIGLAPAIGVWGNSLGGYIAARAAGADPRFQALCVNGGSTRPLELPERHPRFWSKVEALVGSDDRALMEQTLAPLTPDWLRSSLRCPLLQLHGAPDSVFLLENARPIHDFAGASDKRLLVWDDGDHCIYNHAEERNAAIADFFAEQLL